jgi:putative redox protein
LEWTGEDLRFSGRGVDPQTPPIILDGSSEAGPAPMDTLLIALAGCTGADAVFILKRMKVALKTVSINLVGERRAEHPKRYVALKFVFRLAGENLERSKAERAVNLSLNKYCSALHSLNPDIKVDHEIELL